MAVSIKQPATTGPEGYGVWLLVDPTDDTGTGQPDAARRVQRVDISADRGSENLFELGNEGIVEIKEDIPVVTLTISGNQVASDIATNSISALQWLALISNNVPFGSTREEIFAIGEPAQVHYANAASATEVDDFDELITSPGTEDSNVMGVTADLLIPIKRGDSLDRVFTVAQAYTTSVGWTFNVDGVATFDATLEADNMTFYQDARRDIDIRSKIVSTTEASGDAITAVEASSTSGVFFAAYLNGEELELGSLGNVDATGARRYVQTNATTLQFTSGMIAAGDVIRYRFSPSTTPVWSGGSGLNYGLTTTAGDQGGIRKDELDIYLLTDTTASRIVCGFEPSLSAGDITINPGYAYVTNSATSGNDLELYEVSAPWTLTNTNTTSATVYTGVVLTSSNGVLVATHNPTVPATSVLVCSLYTDDTNVISCITDRRAFGRTDLALIQNATFRADLSRTVVNQLGYTRNVEKSLNKPVPVTVDITANDVDGELMTLLAGETWGADIAATGEEIKLSELSNTLGIQVNLYSSTSKTDANHKVTIEAIDADVTNISLSSGVGAVGEMSLTLNSDVLRAVTAV